MDGSPCLSANKVLQHWMEHYEASLDHSPAADYPSLYAAAQRAQCQMATLTLTLSQLQSETGNKDAQEWDCCWVWQNNFIQVAEEGDDADQRRTAPPFPESIEIGNGTHRMAWWVMVVVRDTLYCEFYKPLHMLHFAYIDIKSAFDSVDRNYLFLALKGIGVPTSL